MKCEHCGLNLISYTYKHNGVAVVAYRCIQRHRQQTPWGQGTRKINLSKDKNKIFPHLKTLD